MLILVILQSFPRKTSIILRFSFCGPPWHLNNK